MQIEASKDGNNLWLIGAGVMAQDYYKVLKGLGREAIVIGRGQESVDNFQKVTGDRAFSGGLEAFLAARPAPATHAIVSVSREQLSEVTCRLLEAGVQNILVEKPAGLSNTEVKSVHENARGAKVVIGFNRRFYSSVIEAKRLIDQDGGVKSFSFEFTEWAHKLEPLVSAKGPIVMKTWFLGNSIHVADLAFHLGGTPRELQTFATGGLSWHPSASNFAGAGISKTDALFSYQANWESPGRWGVDIRTANLQLILRPLEELQLTRKGSIAIEKVTLDDRLDKQFKPGLYLQTKSFLEGELREFCDIEELCASFPTYLKIAHYA
jgi:predicted dehydrogenase